MEIGIVTFQNSNNYGALLQAYALTKYLENKGHNVFILDYISEPIIKDRSSQSLVKKIFNFEIIYAKICRKISKKAYCKI